MEEKRGRSDSPNCRFDVIGLLASADGYGAIASILRDLPSDFTVSVVVSQHPGRHVSKLPEMLVGKNNYAGIVGGQRRVDHPGSYLTPRRIAEWQTPTGSPTRLRLECRQAE